MIMLHFVNEDNLDDVLKLKAAEKFVAPNYYSLAEAYVSLKESIDKNEPNIAEIPFAINNGDITVGFAMIAFEDGKDVGSDGEIYWISRFMIDESQQGKGYGKAAIAALIEYVKTKPHGREVRYVYTSVVPDNYIAAGLYERMGFVKTGGQLGGEDLMKLVL